MKFYKALPLLSVVLSLVLSLVCVLALGAPEAAPSAQEIKVTHTPAFNANTEFEGTRVVAVTQKQAEVPAYDINMIYRVLQLNRVYGDWLYDDTALIEEAQLTLIDRVQTVDGAQVISRQEVQDFIKALYGRTVDADNTDEYYTVAPRGYEPMGHIITHISEKDGLLTVTSTLRFGGSERFTATTTLAPCQNDFGYMILSAEISE